MTKITLLAHKIREGRWDAFTDAYRRLNTATTVPIEVRTLNKALKRAGVRRREDLPNLLKFTEKKKYLCISFDITARGQFILFSGSNIPHRIEDPPLSDPI